MSMLEDIADRLAKRTLDVLERVDDEFLPRKVEEAIGNASPTLKEAYATAIRIRRAERAAIAVLDRIGGPER